MYCHRTWGSSCSLELPDHVFRWYSVLECNAGHPSEDLHHGLVASAWLSDGGKHLNNVAVVVFVDGYVGASVVGIDPLGSTVDSAWTLPLPGLGVGVLPVLGGGSSGAEYLSFLAAVPVYGYAFASLRVGKQVGAPDIFFWLRGSGRLIVLDTALSVSDWNAACILTCHSGLISCDVR